jgi:hypothetical protein
MPLEAAETNGPSRARPWILRSDVNSFEYLYQDAEWLRRLASGPQLAQRFEKTRLCRTAVILYSFSLEALVNRALAAFLPDHLKEFFLGREDSLKVQEKWQLLPLLAGAGQSFDTSCYPWSHFAELITLRNEFVHPKHDRPAYYRLLSPAEFEPLEFNKIPSDAGISEKDVVYRQMRIPRDPYSLLPEHLDRVKKVVDDTIAELDRLLGGRLTVGNFLGTDEMTVVYPRGATLARPPGGHTSLVEEPRKEQQ